MTISVRGGARFRQEMAGCLPTGFVLPEPFGILCDWLEDRDLIVETASGRIGVLHDDTEVRAHWTDTHRPGGPLIELAPSRSREWFMTTFGVAIPKVGTEIVPHLAEYGDDSPDPFCRWLNGVLGLGDRS